VRLQVAADDRTGAFESAAALADRTGVPVPVAVWPDRPPSGASCGVTDLASRHLDPADAAARAATLPSRGRLAHKIDSTLRGNWATELAARHSTTGMPVAVVPALPALGRVCIDGVVLVDGVPVHESDARLDPHGGPASSRPGELLEAAGAPVVEIRDRAALSAWFAAPIGVAVVDADDQRAIDAVVDRWHNTTGILLAGTSAVIGTAIGRPTRHAPTRIVQPPTVVVCGSAHPVAAAQIDRVRTRGGEVVDRFVPDVLRAMEAGTPVVLRVPAPDGPITPLQATAAMQSLMQEAASLIESGHVGTLVLIGGDTTAALLGDALVVVLGSVVPGTALVESLVVDIPVITRAGGFGTDDALVDLLWGNGR
jgi:D-threonate/D-erythronate kinase